MIFEISDELGIFDKVMNDAQRQADINNGGVVSAPSISILNKV